MSSTAPGLAWQEALKRTKLKSDLLTNINMLQMLLMPEKGISGGTCHVIYQHVKVNNKYKKDHDKNKESSYLKYCDVNNLYN